MSDPPFGFTAAGLFCYQSSDDRTLFHYVPAGPLPDVTAGMPAVRPLSATTGQLALAVAWLPAPGAVAALEQELAQRYADIAALIEVRMAPPADLLVDVVELAWRDGGEEDAAMEVLASSPSVRTPPYHATLSATLDAAQMARVRGVLENGLPGTLLLTLRYALTVPVRATASIAGSVASTLAARTDAFGGTWDDAAAGEVLDAALAAGALTADVLVTPPGELGRPLAEQALDTARRSAVRMIAAAPAPSSPPPAEADRDLVRAPRGRHAQERQPAPPPPPEPQSAIAASASVNARVRVPPEDAPHPWLVATTDLGAWLAAGRQSS